DLDGIVEESLAIQPHGADHFPNLLSRHGVPENVAVSSQNWFRRNRFLGLQLFPETIALLTAARSGALQRTVGILTTGPTEVQREKLRLLELTDLVDFVLISEEFGVPKPDPAIFEAALSLGRARRKSAVFVGDSAEYDIAGARAAGIH